MRVYDVRGKVDFAGFRRLGFGDIEDWGLGFRV